jgi:hypothetical protein
MQLKSVTGFSVEVSDVEILRAAGAIYQARRKVHAGPPRKQVPCAWCTRVFDGHAALESHQRKGCEQSLGSQMGLMAQSDLLDADNGISPKP